MHLPNSFTANFNRQCSKTMKLKSQIFKWTWTETIFFIFYFLVLQLITDVQYVHNEGGPYSFWNSLVDRSVAFVLLFFAHAFYYKVLAYQLLLKKKYWAFFGALIAYLFLFDWYLRLIDGITYQLTFLDARERHWAKQSWQSSWFNFFSRQTLQLTFMNLFSLTALAYFLKSLRDERTMHALKQQQLQMELSGLKAQLNPHFFFNTLNNIYSLAQQGSTHTAGTVAELSELMRYVLYETGSDTVPLEREIYFIKNYIELERIRHADSNAINFEWQGNAGTVTIAPLLFVPFIENAFKHGIQEDTGKGFVEIIMILTGNELTVEIKNSKPEKTVEKKPTGIGLANAGKRLELLYPGRHTLVINDTGAFFEVSLTIHLA